MVMCLWTDDGTSCGKKRRSYAARRQMVNTKSRESEDGRQELKVGKIWLESGIIRRDWNWKSGEIVGKH